MSESIVELAQIRELVTKILDELQLDAYLFEVEPREGQWELRVKYHISYEYCPRSPLL